MARSAGISARNPSLFNHSANFARLGSKLRTCSSGCSMKRTGRPITRLNTSTVCGIVNSSPAISSALPTKSCGFSKASATSAPISPVAIICTFVSGCSANVHEPAEIIWRKKSLAHLPGCFPFVPLSATKQIDAEPQGPDGDEEEHSSQSNGIDELNIQYPTKSIKERKDAQHGREKTESGLFVSKKEAMPSHQIPPRLDSR